MSSNHDESKLDMTMPGTSALGDLPRALHRPYLLELVRGPGSPRTYRLERPYLVVGRLPTADIAIDSVELSRQHLRLARLGTEYHCEDMGSRNGVFLNGIKIHSAVLRDGDQLQLGDLVFVYQEGR